MLKSLLSLLLSLFYSKSESAEVASQSLPNETDFTSVTLNTSQPDTFAAPYDGYLCIVVDTGGSINVWGDGLQSSNYSLNNGQSKLFVPMRKGNIIGYSISGRLIFGKFYKLVGGGYNTIEKLIRRGGAICLSNLCSSLRRSSWLAKSLGFTKIPSLLRTTLSPCFQVRQEFQNEATQRRLMEWPLSLLEKHRPKIFPVSWMSTVSGDNSSKTLNKVGKLIRLFTSLKATFFTWQQGAVIQRSVSSCSIPRPNLTVGGASC